MKLVDGKLRVELFSDAVIAIVITIAALEILIPHDGMYRQFIESLLTFAISFFIVAGYWKDHRKLFEQVEEINDRFVFRNTCFLFSLVLIPVFTKWSMEYGDKQLPMLAYGVLLMLINATFSGLFMAGISLAKEPVEETFYFKKLYKNRDRVYYLAILLVMGVGYFIPQLALVLFIGLPIISYFLKTNFEEKFEDEQWAERRRNRRHKHVK
ncbi:TMEM175 family protein [Enterococcus rotai]|uniref:TMEM175 family protein n=1 Tax=Enterococcus rotai TaxID=118060 RepID=UPI0032B41D62